MVEIRNPHLYVFTAFAGRYLFIPQDEVHSVEIVADIQRAQTDIGAIGWFVGHNSESPVFSLTYELSLLPELPNNREYFILLKADPQPLGITCEEVENVNFQAKHLHQQNLPAVMKIPQTPIKQLLIYQDKIACICSGTALVKHLSVLGGFSDSITQ